MRPSGTVALSTGISPPLLLIDPPDASTMGADISLGNTVDILAHPKQLQGIQDRTYIQDRYNSPYNHAISPLQHQPY
jgi:hypothetical protein